MRRIIGFGISCCLVGTVLMFPACEQALETTANIPEDSELTTSPVASSIIPSETQVPVSPEQAIAIAGQLFPISILLESTITTQLTSDSAHIYYHVNFDDFTATSADLLPYWSTTSLPTSTPVFHTATINVDAQSGAILLRIVSAVRLGGPITVLIPPYVARTIAPRTEWQDITSIYTNETRPINVKVGERFLIRYDMAENDMFPKFDAVYDPEVIELLGTAVMPLEQAPYYTGWLCFQALKTGSTQITVLHESWHFATNAAEPNLIEQKVFQVIITG